MKYNEYKANPEYIKQKEIIEAQHGKAEFDYDHSPLNESAKKLLELKKSLYRIKVEKENSKKLTDKLKDIAAVLPIKHLAVPEEVIRQEWLIAFNDKQKRIIKQWICNIKQTPKQISDYLNIPTEAVVNTMSLEAFKLLRSHLALACKEMLPLESILAVREVLASSQDATKLKAALTMLIDAGLVKDSQLEIDINKSEKVLDKDMEAKLRELGNKVLGIGKDEQV